MQTMAHFTVFIVWWPWKLGQGHENVTHPFNYPNYTTYKFALNPSFGSRDRVQTSLCVCVGGGGQNFTLKVLAWPLKWGQGHLNLIISSTCPNGVAMQVKSKSTNWFRIYNAERLMFTVFVVWWPWKLDQGHQNLINLQTILTLQ